MFSIDTKGLGVFELFKRTIRDFIDDDLAVYAAALAYQMFFSLFPFLIFLVALIGYLDLQPFFDWLRQQAALLLPVDAMSQIDPAIDRFQEQRSGLFSLGILVALWTSSSAVRLVMVATNKAYDVEEGRPLWKRFPLSLFYTVGLTAMLLSAAALMVVGPELMNWLARWVGLEQFMVTLWAILRWPLAIFLLILALAVVYYVAPDVQQEFRFITPGSIFAGLGWVAASLGFGFYVQNFSNYNALYGGIGAVIVLLLYFFISSAVLLFGAELNAVIEHHSPEGKDPGEKTLD